MSTDFNELERLKDVLETGLLDTPYEKEFDELTRLASIICETPIAIISLIDDGRQWYKSKIGIDFSEVKLNETICQYTIKQDELLEIPNTTEHDYSRNSPHVLHEGGMRFYAGVPLKSNRGYNIGTVCVVDMIPKKLNDNQKAALSIIGLQAQRLIQIRSKNTHLGSELGRMLEQRIEEKEKEVIRTREAYNALYVAMSKSSAMVEFSPFGDIIAVNSKFLELSGYEEYELINRHHSILICDDELKDNMEFWLALKNGKVQSGRMKRRRKDGAIFWLQATYNPIVNPDGEVEKVIKVAQNITPEVEADQAMKKAKAIAENLNSQKDSFIANMSHEIRTPINAILGFSELLYESEDRPGKKEHLEAIRIAGYKLLHLVNDILDLSKIEAGVIRIERSPYSVQKLVNNVFSLFKLEVSKKGLIYSCQIADEVPETLLGDKNRISQVLTNLISNSLKFTNQGFVKLEVEVKDANLVYSVSDSGIGISKVSKERIFGRFSQAEESTFRRYGGTGLGLNISKTLVEKMGGELAFESSEGEGSRFYFTLPIEETSEESQVIIDAIHTDDLDCDLLVFEDNELNQRLIAAVFNQSKVKLDFAENGIKGLELLSKNHYDLILMDIQMPLMDGYQTSEHIREKLHLKTPIIALTAHSMLVERDRCLKVGMNDYLSKPFEKNVLLRKMLFWLQKANNESQLSDIINEDQSESKKIFSLEYLKEMAGGDLGFINEMIQMFRNQIEALPEEIQKLIDNGEYAELKNRLHKLKSSFGMFQVPSQILTQMELALEGNPNPKLLQAYFLDLKQMLFYLMKEMNNL